MKPPLTTVCSHCAWMLKEGSDVTFTFASISSTEDQPISSVYNIFRHPVHVKLWVKILCNTITHQQQVHNHSIIVSEKMLYSQYLKFVFKNLKRLFKQRGSSPPVPPMPVLPLGGIKSTFLLPVRDSMETTTSVVHL